MAGGWLCAAPGHVCVLASPLCLQAFSLKLSGTVRRSPCVVTMPTRVHELQGGAMFRHVMFMASVVHGGLGRDGKVRTYWARSTRDSAVSGAWAVWEVLSSPWPCSSSSMFWPEDEWHYEGFAVDVFRRLFGTALDKMEYRAGGVVTNPTYFLRVLGLPSGSQLLVSLG